MSQKFQMMLQIAESSFEKLPKVCRNSAYVKRHLDLHDALYTAMTLARTKAERGRVYRISQTIWSELLAAGANPSEVRDLLSPCYIWRHYDKVKASKINVNSYELMYQLIQVKGRGFVLKNLKKFQQRGIDVDTIAMNCYRIKTKHDLEVQCAEMRVLGVNLTTIFVMANQLLIQESLNPASVYCLLHFFYQQNLSPGLIAAWIKDRLTEKILDSIIAADPLDWTIFGINLDDYRPIWVTGKFLRFFKLEPDFKKLPPTITITQFLNYLHFQQIHFAIKSDFHKFENFIKNYLTSGGTIDLLADKYEHEDFDFFCPKEDILQIGVILLKYGATNINRENLIELFKQCNLSEDKRIEYARILNQKEI